MQHLKNLILTFPYEERIPDQSVVAAEDEVQKAVDAIPMKIVSQEQLPPSGTIVPADSAYVNLKYSRLVATRGNDYLLVYNYNGRPMRINLAKIVGEKKKAWWYSPSTGKYTYIGEFKNRMTEFIPLDCGVGKDVVLVVTDATSSYVKSHSYDELMDAKGYEE